MTIRAHARIGALSVNTPRVEVPARIGIAKLIDDENVREDETIRLIASENYASRAVMEATGSVLTNKYSEGYAHKRYYEGQQVINQVEELAIARLKKLFAPGA